MASIFKEWWEDIVDNKKKILLAILFLVIAVLLTMALGDYVMEARTIAVPDLILDHIPAMDLSPIYVYGLIIVLLLFILYPLMYTPHKFHYYIGMLSLFLVIRACFTTLTHLRAPLDAVPISAPSFIGFLTYGNDLFFSGHTGIPFLGFLIFKNKKIKYFMLGMSIILAATVLVMHVHYSIDVAAAYFITYTIYRIGNKIFNGGI